MRKNISILFTLYLLTILFLIVFPTKETGINLDFYLFGIASDKYIHALLFTPFLMFCYFIFKKENFLICIMFGIFFASFCECLHYFIPYRDFSTYDFYANVTGIVAGSLMYLKKSF